MKMNPVVKKQTERENLKAKLLKNVLYKLWNFRTLRCPTQKVIHSTVK